MIYNVLDKNSILRLISIKKDKVLIGPEKIEIILNTNCNINCIFCWFHSPLIKKNLKAWYLEFDKYKEIISDAQAMGTNHIYLTGWGEPTLHPDLPKMIYYAKQKKIFITLTTNLTFKCKRILDAVTLVDQIDITLCYYSRKEYDKFQSGKTKIYFDRVMQNIYALKNLFLRENKKLFINYIVNKTNYHNIENFINFVQKVKIKNIRFSAFKYTPQTLSLCLNNKTLRETNKKINNLIKNSNLNVQNGLEVASPIKLRRCFMGWFVMLIDAYGKIRIGCMDPAAPTIAGDIYRSSIKEIWYSKKAQNIRLYLKNHLKREYHCNFYFKNIKINNFLKYKINANI